MILAYSLDLPVRILAVVGAAALGALFVAGSVQVFVRMVFGQKVPRWPLLLLAVLGAALWGYIISLWLFGGGGSGMGGPGGYDVGSGIANVSEGEDAGLKKSDGKEKTSDSNPPGALVETLTIEVLGDAPLKKLAKSENFESGKRYRLVDQNALMSLEEVKSFIRSRRDTQPPLRRLEVILYLDSPDRQGSQVAALVDWANDLELAGKKWLRVDFSVKDRYAPLE